MQQEQRDSPKRQWLIWLLSGAIILTIIGVLIWYYLVVYTTTSGHHQTDQICQLRPFDSMITRPRTKFDETFTFLVSFDGYLQFDLTPNQGSSAEVTYLPLELHRINVEQMNGGTSLILWTNCGRMTLNLVQHSKQIMVGNIDIEMRYSNDSKLFSTECIIESTQFALKNYQDNYYSCKSNIDFPCRKREWKKDMSSFTMHKKANLRLLQLELEMYGNRDNMTSGIFSKKQERCSFVDIN